MIARATHLLADLLVLPSRLLAEAEVPETAYHYKPFLTPLPVWGDGRWPFLLIPLCIAVAVTYKSIKCQQMKQVPKEAAVLTGWIVVGMALAAVGLGLLVEMIERANR